MKRKRNGLNYQTLEDRKMLALCIPTFQPSDIVFIGGQGADEISTGIGSQFAHGHTGDDVFRSLGDAGEPLAKQDETYEPIKTRDTSNDDTFIGDVGADVYEFNPLINATDEIILKHTTDGVVDWTASGVAGENNNVHDHWVEGIGEDSILGFVSGEDHILIEGHTVSVDLTNFDGWSLIQITSDQGAGGGAHDGDQLGYISVYGDPVQESDITINAGVFHGVDQLDDWELPEAPDPEEETNELQDLLDQLRATLNALDAYFASLGFN